MSDDNLVARVDAELTAEIHNKAFELIDQVCDRYTHDDVRTDVAEGIFSLVREYAPIIMECARGQARAERAIAQAVWAQFAQPEQATAQPTRYFCPHCQYYADTSMLVGAGPYTCPECGTGLKYDDPLKEREG